MPSFLCPTPSLPQLRHNPIAKGAHVRQLVAAARVEKDDLLVAEDVREIPERELFFQFGGGDRGGFGFSQWVAGGEFKVGHVHGETDEFSHKAVVDPVHHYDWHATLLHAFGRDHRKLTYKRNGLAASLTPTE